MKKVLIAAVLVLVPLVAIVVAAPPTPINRTLTIMSYVRNQTSGDNIVPIDAAKADEWVEYFYAAYQNDGKVNSSIIDGEGNVIDYASLTNLQKGKFYMNVLREFHRQVRLGQVRSGFAPTVQAALDAANTETDTDLGTTE